MIGPLYVPRADHHMPLWLVILTLLGNLYALVGASVILWRGRKRR